VHVEIITRRLRGGRRMLHVCLPDHVLYLELTAGAQCERRVDGAPAESFGSRSGLLSFRPAGSETRGWTEGPGSVRYCAIRIDPTRFESDGATRMVPQLWRSATAFEDRTIWREALPLLRACKQPRASEWYFDRLYAEGHALALLAVLAARFGRSTEIARSVLPPRRLRVLTDHIQANLGNAVNLAELASVAGMSKSQLVRAFRASTGYTPIDYLVRQRIKEAQRLLASTNVPLSEIAVRLGFADQSHFTRRFRNATGATPAQFRRLAL
jgi:AraC family transcriptional regulator